MSFGSWYLDHITFTHAMYCVAMSSANNTSVFSNTRVQVTVKFSGWKDCIISPINRRGEPNFISSYFEARNFNYFSNTYSISMTNCESLKPHGKLSKSIWEFYKSNWEISQPKWEFFNSMFKVIHGNGCQSWFFTSPRTLYGAFGLTSTDFMLQIPAVQIKGLVEPYT